MRRLEKIENMKSLINPLGDHASHKERALGFNYHSTPTTHTSLINIKPGEYLYENASPYVKRYID
jgi:hypothetical protein